jgi:hypothetical protein
MVVIVVSMSPTTTSTDKAAERLRELGGKYAEMLAKLPEAREGEAAALLELIYFRGYTAPAVAEHLGLSSPESVAKKVRPVANAHGLTRTRGRAPDAEQAAAMAERIGGRPYAELTDAKLFAKLKEFRAAEGKARQFLITKVLPAASKLVVNHGYTVRQVISLSGDPRRDALYTELRLYWARNDIDPPAGHRL